MGESTGRKRTASGVCIEVRAIGDVPEADLTAYVRALLARADEVNASLHLRGELYRVASGKRRGEFDVDALLADVLRTQVEP